MILILVLCKNIACNNTLKNKVQPLKFCIIYRHTLFGIYKYLYTQTDTALILTRSRLIIHIQNTSNTNTYIPMNTCKHIIVRYTHTLHLSVSIHSIKSIVHHCNYDLSCIKRFIITKTSMFQKEILIYTLIHLAVLTLCNLEIVPIILLYNSV